MNLYSAFEELDKLYESEQASKELVENKLVDGIKKVGTRLGADISTIARCFAEITGSDTLYDFMTHVENKAVLKALQSGNEKVLNTLTKEDIEELKQDIAEYEQAKKSGKRVEEAYEENDEDDIIEIENDDEDKVIEDAPATFVLACAECGGLVIKAEADIKAEEDKSAVNVGEACQYCEASEGYEVLGTLIPAEADEGAPEKSEEIDNETAAEEEDNEELTELLDFDVPITVTANGNDVAIGGLTN